MGDHAYAVVGYNPSSLQPYEVFNPWGTDNNGWAPTNQPNTVLGLFWANAASLSDNFAASSFGTGVAAGMADHINGSQQDAVLWGTDSSGWTPSSYSGRQFSGLFNANAAYQSQNFGGKSFGVVAAAGMVDHGNGGARRRRPLDNRLFGVDPKCLQRLDKQKTAM